MLHAMYLILFKVKVHKTIGQKRIDMQCLLNLEKEI